MVQLLKECGEIRTVKGIVSRKEIYHEIKHKVPGEGYDSHRKGHC